MVVDVVELRRGVAALAGFGADGIGHPGAAGDGRGGGDVGIVAVAEGEGHELHFFEKRFRHGQRLACQRGVGTGGSGLHEDAQDAGQRGADHHHEDDELDHGQAARAQTGSAALQGARADQGRLHGNLGR